MKSFFQSNFTLTRKEQYGIIGFITLICIVFGISFLTRYYSKAKVPIEEEQLNAAWQQLQDAQQAEVSESKPTSAQAELFYFDPNRLDSLGFIRLGLSPKTTHYLLNWRHKGKHFYKKEELRALYSLSENEYSRLAPYIQISETEHMILDPSNEKQALLPPVIELNKTDSAILTRLKGIGPYLAHKIIERRKALGGFIQHEQLLEIYKFPDTTYAYLKEKLSIDPTAVQKIKLNLSDEAQMAAHPYIGPTMAKNILLLRKGLNKYENVTQLRQVPLMNEEKYRKIAAYCTID